MGRPYIPSSPPPYMPSPRLPSDRAERRPDAPQPLMVPAALRGGFWLDTASLTYSGGDFSAISLALAASVPLTRSDYLDVRLPLGLTIRSKTDASIGNIDLGYHRVFRPRRKIWLTLGASLGLPMVSGKSQDQDSTEGPPSAMGYYRLYEYFADTMPMGVQFGGEWMSGPVTLRGEVRMVVGIPLRTNDQTELFLPHAVEVQVGQRLGVGLRVQGIGLPTFGSIDVPHSVEGQLYQAAIEPFFVFEHKPVFMRLGLMMPLDEPLGPPFKDAWGFRMAVGARVE